MRTANRANRPENTTPGWYLPLAVAASLCVGCTQQSQRAQTNGGSQVLKSAGTESAQSEISKTGKATPLDSLRAHHVAISVPNSKFEETIQWYQEKLGFRVINRREHPEISTKAANLELNGFQVEVFARDKSTPVLEARREPYVDDLLVQGVKHIAFTVDDLDTAVAQLRRRGVEFASEPSVNNALGLKLCFIKDNNGYLIELGQELNQNLEK